MSSTLPSIPLESSTRQINLPVQSSPLIGREVELAALAKLLADLHCRLLTITGMGGIGKTRLAIEVAANSQENFQDGVTFVSLSGLNSPAFIVPAITDALGLHLAGPQDPREQLLNALYKKKLLLVLDNAEHLLDGVRLFTEILENAPNLKLLVTSRERLSLQEEWVFEIQGLPVPPDGKVEQVEQYSSIALFVQRARQTKIEFNLTPDELAWIVHICQIVEGMPLAIELAAAWVSMLTCKEISQEIEANLDFLATNVRNIPQRHRSLRATFDHSWNRLNPDEQVEFSKLSVFRGGFTRKAAKQVAGASLPILSALVAKSLIYRKSDTHFDMHQLVQQYVAEKLQENSQALVQTREQHRKYFVDFLTELHPKIRGPNIQAVLKTIQSDLDNVRDAWQRTVAEGRFIGLRQAEKCLYDFYELNNRLVEGYSIISLTVEGLRAEIVKHPDDIESKTLLGLLLIDQSYFGAGFLRRSNVIVLARQGYEILRDGNDQSAYGYAALWLALLASEAGSLSSMEQHILESLEIFKQCGDERGVAAALGTRARLELARRRYEDGIQAVVLAGSIYRRYEDHDSLCRTLIVHGELELHLGNYDSAEALLIEALELSKLTRVSGHTGLALCRLAQLAQKKNNLQKARDLIEESMVFLSEQDSFINRALIFQNFGDVLCAQGDFDHAKLWLGTSLQLLDSLEIISPAFDVLFDYAHLLYRQGCIQQSLGLLSFLMGEPRVRPLTKYYTEQHYAELLPELTPAQVQAAREYAQDHALEAIISEIIGG
ncbi:MAG: tetratricopeptide repeat protein [Omnitrophica WOR_2 bacterium]